jgi:hypothetical protein
MTLIIMQMYIESLLLCKAKSLDSVIQIGNFENHFRIGIKIKKVLGKRSNFASENLFK